MAISFTQTPVTYSPAYNPLLFTALSTNIAQPNFRYKWKITVGSEVTTIIQSPRPDGYSLLDVHRIVESYLSTDITISAADFTQNTNSWVSYSVTCTESYGSPATDHTTYSAGARTAVNACLTYNGFYGWAYTPFVIGSGNGARFLTNAPKTQKIRDGQYGWTHFYTTTASATNARTLRLWTLSSSGAVINTIDFTNPYSIATPYNFVRFPSGMENLRTMYFGTYGSGDPFAGASAYEFQILSASASGMSEVLKFEIDEKCTPFEVVRLHFLNELGGFDSFNFINKSSKVADISRSSFKKLSGAFSSGSYTFGQADRGDVQFNTVVSDRMQLNSDWISDEESEWLKELFTSPQVYLENPDGYLVAVNLMNPSYETKSVSKDRLFSISCELALAIDNTRQRF